MRTIRQTNIRRALLTALHAWQGFLMPDDLFRIEGGRLGPLPAATTAELDEEIRVADRARLITGVTGEDAQKWKIADAGRAWLAENP